MSAPAFTEQDFFPHIFLYFWILIVLFFRLGNFGECLDNKKSDPFWIAQIGKTKKRASALSFILTVFFWLIFLHFYSTNYCLISQHFSWFSPHFLQYKLAFFVIYISKKMIYNINYTSQLSSWDFFICLANLHKI